MPAAPWVRLSGGVLSVVLLLPALLCGCVTYSPVAFELPLNRMESPEPMRAPASVGAGIAKSNYLILTQDQKTQPPNPEHPEVGGNPELDLLEAGYLRGDLRIVPRVEVGVRKSSDELLMAQVKLLLAGAPSGNPGAGKRSAAFSLGYGRDEADIKSRDGAGAYRTRLDRDVIDLALIVGQRSTRWLLIYGGIYYNVHRYDGEYRVDYNDGTQDAALGIEGNARVTGLNLGLDFNLGVRWASGILECARAYIDAGATQDYRTSCGAGIRVQLGRASGA